MKHAYRPPLLRATCAAVALLGAAGFASAQDRLAPQQSGVLTPITTPLVGDGTMSANARNSMLYGPLPASQADVDAKAAATAAHRAAVRRGLPAAPAHPSDGAGSTGQQAPTGLAGWAGQQDATGTPPDTTGAIGPTRYIQTVNRRYGVYLRNGTLLNQGTLNTLFGANANNFDPQLIWDPTTFRFYYTGDTVVSATNNRLAFGFSKTSQPNNGSTHFCHYSLPYGNEFPDYPKMGDNARFILIGVNIYPGGAGGYIRADVVAIRKPANGNITNCPNISWYRFLNLRDSTNARVFTVTPGNQIDRTFRNGIAWARNLSLPSNRMWFFNFGWNAANVPVRSAAKLLTLPFTNAIPAGATQPTFTQVLDTSDTRGQNATLAWNPQRGGWSFWTQNTVRAGTTSTIRFYEINPFGPGGQPVIRRAGNVPVSSCFKYNAALSPDRKVRAGTPSQWGNNWIVNYSVSGSTGCNLNPRIVEGSSVNGGGLTFRLVRNGTAPYRDFSCAAGGSQCRWGDYSGATPDVNPSGSATRGSVWATNQYSNVANASVAIANWRTWIWQSRP